MHSLPLSDSLTILLSATEKSFIYPSKAGQGQPTPPLAASLCQSEQCWQGLGTAPPEHLAQCSGMCNAPGLQAVLISPTHSFTLLQRCYEWLCSWECPCRGEQCSGGGHSPASPAGNKCRTSLLTVLIKAEKLKLLFRLIKKTCQKNQLKYFLNVHLSLICLAFQALFRSKFSLSFLCFPIALWNSSFWTCIQRKNTAQCNSLWLSIIHFALVTAIISSENRNGGKQNISSNITN